MRWEYEGRGPGLCHPFRKTGRGVYGYGETKGVKPGVEAKAIGPQHPLRRVRGTRCESAWSHGCGTRNQSI